MWHTPQLPVSSSSQVSSLLIASKRGRVNTMLINRLQYLTLFFPPPTTPAASVFLHDGAPLCVSVCLSERVCIIATSIKEVTCVAHSLGCKTAGWQKWWIVAGHCAHRACRSFRTETGGGRRLLLTQWQPQESVHFSRVLILERAIDWL